MFFIDFVGEYLNLEGMVHVSNIQKKTIERSMF
jgi:hypothetical protein